MRSFWSKFNSGLLFFSLVAWIGGAIILASSFKDSMESDRLIVLLFTAIFLILTFHSFWGMLVEMSKNVIDSSGQDNLAQENEELKRMNEELIEKNIELTSLVEKTKNVISRELIKSGEQNNLAWENKKLAKENRELKEELNELSDELNEVSAQLRLQNPQSSEQDISFNDSAQEQYEQNYVKNNDKKKDTRPWICNRCGNFNPAISVICGSCGQKKSGQ